MIAINERSKLAMDDQSMKSVEFEEFRNVIILHLNGDMNSCKVMNFEGILEEILAKNPITIAVNCRMLFVIDPATISQIAKYLKKTKSNKIELLFFNLNPEVQLTFELMKLDGFFTVISQERFETEYLNNKMIS